MYSPMTVNPFTKVTNRRDPPAWNALIPVIITVNYIIDISSN